MGPKSAYDVEHKAIVVNPFALYENLKGVFNDYMADLENGGIALSRFRQVWTEDSFERPQISSDWNKFKSMVPDHLRFKCERCGDFFSRCTDTHFRRCKG